jgi:hypothetical protein
MIFCFQSNEEGRAVTSVVVRILCRFQWKGLVLHLNLWCLLFFLGGYEAHAFHSLLGHRFLSERFSSPC